MLNTIWLGLVLAAFVLGGATGTLDAVTLGALDAAKTAVMSLALPLLGLWSLWLGLMRLAERSGLVEVLARGLRPAMKWLFPDVPAGHPAQGAIVLNMAANMLGLSNAATPLGLRAMQLLERLNPRPGTATNAMCTFLAVNTSSIQLLPTTVVAILAASGSTNPTAIIGPAFVATLCSTIAGITAVRFLEKLPAYRLPAIEPPVPDSSNDGDENAGEAPPTPTVAPLPAWGGVVLILFFGFAAYAGYLITQNPPPDLPVNVFTLTLHAISTLAIPFLLAFFPLYAALRRVPVYEEFVEGAKEGFHTAVRVIPFLVAILVAIGMFRAAGGIQLLAQGLGPALSVIGFPVELLPLVLMRPLSGSGATGLYSDLVTSAGPDSMVSLMGGAIMGSTETTFYVIAVYFGSVAIRRTRHAVPAGLIADLTGVIASIAICRLMFG